MSTFRWLVTGAGGQLGGHLLRLLRNDADQLLPLARRPLPGWDAPSVDFSDLSAVQGVIRAWKPTHILHCGAMTALAECYQDPAAAERVNLAATRLMAEEADRLGAMLAFTSTDMVFDGAAAPYDESSPVSPVSVYARTKVDAERALDGRPRTLVLRIPLLYGMPLSARETTFSRQMAALRGGRTLRLFHDEFRTPLWLGDAARILVELARERVTGLLHAAGPERLSRLELVQRCARRLALQPRIESISRLDVEAPEPRPGDLSLDGRRLVEAFPRLTPHPLDDVPLEAFS